MQRRPRPRLAASKVLALAVLEALLIAVVGALPVRAVAGWQGPQLVGASGKCSEVDAAIDSSGRYHVVASCSGRIRYAVGAAGSWSTTTFGRSANQTDDHPFIAIDGTTVYVAFAHHTDTDEDCPDCVGESEVRYRSRSLPSGQWSVAKRLGSGEDTLESFRVVDGRIHATVFSGPFDGALLYETNASGTLKRYALPAAMGGSALRVGSDGRARVVYRTASSLRYARFTGSGFTGSTIPGTTGSEGGLSLVLDGGNHPHVAWSYDDAANLTSVPDGTYYATNATGSWTAPTDRRITGRLGPVALTLNPATGRLHVLIGTTAGVRYFTKPVSGPWSGATLTSAIAADVVIRLDTTRNRLLAVYARETKGQAASVYALTKP